jgi:hypothetical protein
MAETIDAALVEVGNDVEWERSIPAYGTFFTRNGASIKPEITRPAAAAFEYASEIPLP